MSDQLYHNRWTVQVDGISPAGIYRLTESMAESVAVEQQLRYPKAQVDLVEHSFGQEIARHPLQHQQIWLSRPTPS